MNLSVHRHLLMFAIIAAVLLMLLIILIGFYRHRSKTLNEKYFRSRWQELQALLTETRTWPLAIINADKLLDKALKQRRFKGRTIGERLVSAQHDLSSNDTVWYGHKLRNKLVHEDYKLIRKTEVKTALLGYLQALKDLGALRRDK